jgi:hypothetical protein
MAKDKKLFELRGKALADELVRRMEQTSEQEFTTVISDVMLALVAGYITPKEAEPINRASAKQLRKWRAKLQAEKAELKRKGLL